MNKSTLTLKLNPNNKIDLSKLNTVKSTKVIKVKVEKSPNKFSKDKLESKVVKPKKLKPKKISTPPPEKVVLDFQKIYNNLHNKFPNIINMDNSLTLSIGIHKELAKELGISNRSIGKWFSWYTRKSKYYNNHKEGVVRFNLEGKQCKTVTEQEANYATSRTTNWLKKKEEKQRIK